MRSKFAKKGSKKRRNFSKIPQFWSFSRWDDFNKCPFFFALKHIAKVKIPEEENYHFEHGNMIHKLSEGFVKGEIRTVPRELSTFHEEFLAVRKLEAAAEVDYTITKDWLPTTGDDFENAWCRAKLDIVVELAEPFTLIDVKTGKARDVHEQQGELYGMLGLDRFEDVPEVDAEFWYIDSGEVETLHFDKGQLPALKKTWLKRIKPMLEGRLFQKTPSENSCYFCPYRSDKVLASGEPGECEAWKKVS